jgi:hypothetical protein
MCGSRPKDNSAEIARRQEEERRQRVQQGTARVNENFAGFNDDFYSGLGKSYLDYYTPQLEDQYQNAQKQAIFNFANRGNLGSSANNQFMADLAKHYQTQRSQLAEQALGEQQRMRGEVERNRADLIAQLEAGAGVESAAQSAMARANALTAPPQYSALGDVFATLTGTLRDSMALQRQGYAGLPFTRRDPATSGAGSSSVVRVN